MPPPDVPIALEAPFLEIDQGMAMNGATVYNQCQFCHGGMAVSGGSAPDLRASSIVLNDAAFSAVVRDGDLAERGMPAYPDLSDQQLKELQHFIRQMARTEDYSVIGF